MANSLLKLMLQVPFAMIRDEVSLSFRRTFTRALVICARAACCLIIQLAVLSASLTMRSGKIAIKKFSDRKIIKKHNCAFFYREADWGSCERLYSQLSIQP